MIPAFLFALCYRIRGGFGNEITRRLLKKPQGWEIENGYIRILCAISLAITAFGWNPTIWQVLLAFAGIAPGYFKGKFDLSLKENRTWQNYAWLSARGMFICLPLALCFGLSYPQLWLGVLAGALMPACYLAGQIVGKYSKLQSPSQWGEWLIGLSIGIVL